MSIRLYKFIREHIYKYEISNRHLAKIANVHDTHISKWLQGKARLNFLSTLSIIRELVPDKEFELMGDYALTAKRSEEMKVALEYCVANSLPQREELITKMRDVDPEWANVYFIGSLRAVSDPDHVLEQLDELKTKSIEMKAYKILLRMMLYYDKRDFKPMDELARRLRVAIKRIESDFLKKSYLVRSNQLHAITKLYNDEVEECRESAKQMIEQENARVLIASGYQLMGETYLYTDYELSKSYLLKAHHHFLTIFKHPRWALQSLNLLDFVWNKVPEHIDFESLRPHDVLNAVSYYIIKGEKELALAHLHKISFDQLNEQLKAYYLYYSYYIHQNKDDLYKSIDHFQNAGDRFFRKLALRELEKLNMNRVLLKILAK